MNTQMQVSGPGTFAVRPGKQTIHEFIAALAKEENCAKPPILWGRVLGLTLTVVISAGCWALIIGLLLR